MDSTVKVLIVDDSIMSRTMISMKLAHNPDIQVVGLASDGKRAVEMARELKPDVITTDFEMPGMNGIELIHALLEVIKIPVIIVSASNNIGVFDAMKEGAVDFVRKPDNQVVGVDDFIEELTAKIRIAAKAKVRVTGSLKDTLAGFKIAGSPGGNQPVIAIGASTGGTEATLEVVRNLPPETPGIVVVQHMPAGFTKMYADRLNGICKMRAAEARNGDLIETGKILIAPGDYQLRVMKRGADYSVSCLPGDKVSGHCPSVDVLFDSVAKAAGKNAIGIIMTGMGRDGASGLLKMRQGGAYTIGQDKDSCVVYGMPMVAYDIGAVAVQAPCDKIAEVLMRELGKQH